MHPKAYVFLSLVLTEIDGVEIAPCWIPAPTRIPWQMFSSSLFFNFSVESIKLDVLRRQNGNLWQKTEIKKEDARTHTHIYWIPAYMRLLCWFSPQRLRCDVSNVQVAIPLTNSFNRWNWSRTSTVVRTAHGENKTKMRAIITESNLCKS